MLDSDIGNTILPHVRFYQKEVKNEFNSQKEGRPIYYMADFVRIEIPGNQYSVIDTFAHKGHQEKYPVQWARYQNDKRDLGEEDITGTLLRDWPLITAAQAKELKHYHFYTVEQVAQASDEQISKIQMIIGMGAHVFREKAQAYLARAKDSALVNAQSDELRKRDMQIEALQAQINNLIHQIGNTKDSTEPEFNAVKVEKKRGRPAKSEANQEEVLSDE